MATALQNTMKPEAWLLCWKYKNKSKIPQIEMDKNRKFQKLRWIEFDEKPPNHMEKIKSNQLTWIEAWQENPNE